MRVINSSPDIRNVLNNYSGAMPLQRKPSTPVQEEYLEPDEDLRRAISAKELLVGIEADIRAAYRRKNEV